MSEEGKNNMPVDFLVFEGGGKSGMVSQDLGPALVAGGTGMFTGQSVPSMGKGMGQTPRK